MDSTPTPHTNDSHEETINAKLLLEVHADGLCHICHKPRISKGWMGCSYPHGMVPEAPVHPDHPDGFWSWKKPNSTRDSSPGSSVQREAQQSGSLSGAEEIAREGGDFGTQLIEALYEKFGSGCFGCMPSEIANLANDLLVKREKR